MSEAEQPPSGSRRRRGQPTKYTAKLAADIIARLSAGEPLAQVCRDEHMPAVRTVSDWKKAHEDFAARFTQAREEGFDAIALEALEIADDGSQDTKVIGKPGEEREVCDTEWVQRSKLRVETRLKLLAKWDPKRYGDKLDVEHKGGIAVTFSGADVDL